MKCWIFSAAFFAIGFGAATSVAHRYDNQERYVPEGEITLSLFKSLIEGTEYEDVVQKIGRKEDDRVISTTTRALIVTWTNLDDSCMVLVFKKGKLESKTQEGLR